MSAWPFKKGPQSVSPFIDMDYIDKLSPKEKKWMEDFVKAEYMVDRKAARRLKGSPLTKKEKSEMDAKNYARRSDATLFPSKKRLK